MGTLVSVDGTQEDYPPAGRGSTGDPSWEYSLEELQGAVGGYIEIVALDKGQHMVLNAEGKLEGLLPNEEATKLACGHIFDRDYIVGDVIMCEPGEIT